MESHRSPDMGEVFLTLYGSVSQETPNDGPQHGHMVLRLHQRAAQHLAWLEYDTQLQMELAASEDRGWKEGDPWQYIACFPNNLQQRVYPDMAEVVPPHRGKGKRVLDPEGGSRRGTGQNPKKPKQPVCCLFNLAPRGCLYGKECLFAHYRAHRQAQNQRATP